MLKKKDRENIIEPLVFIFIKLICLNISQLAETRFHEKMSRMLQNCLSIINREEIFFYSKDCLFYPTT